MSVLNASTSDTKLCVVAAGNLVINYVQMIEVEMHIKNVTQFCQIQIQNNELLGMVIYWGNYSNTCILYVTCQSRIFYTLNTVNYYNNVPLLAMSNKMV